MTLHSQGSKGFINRTCANVILDWSHKHHQTRRSDDHYFLRLRQLCGDLIEASGKRLNISSNGREALKGWRVHAENPTLVKQPPATQKARAGRQNQCRVAVACSQLPNCKLIITRIPPQQIRLAIAVIQASHEPSR